MMRVMGFSSKVGKISVFALALALVTSLGVVGFPSEAQGGSKKLVWSVKFVCHVNLLDETIGEGESLYTGNTVINVHNPTEEVVKLNKKVVYAIRESERPNLNSLEGENIGLKHGEVLTPNDAFFVDCSEIANILFPFLEGEGNLFDLFGESFFEDVFFPFPFIGESPIYFDGFLVIETEGKKVKKRKLVVVAHHWLIGLIAGTSRDIEYINPIVVNGRFRLCPIEVGDGEVEGCVPPPDP